MIIQGAAGRGEDQEAKIGIAQKNGVKQSSRRDWGEDVVGMRNKLYMD